MPDRFARLAHTGRWLSSSAQGRRDAAFTTRKSLDLLINQVETLRASLLTATREVRKLAILERYKENYELLRSIPGIGITVGMPILTEIYDVSRFKNEKQFASYLGTCSDLPQQWRQGIAWREDLPWQQAARSNVNRNMTAVYRDYGLGSLALCVI